MLRSHGVGWGGVGMLTFPRPRSLDLAQDVDATLTWGGVGWGGMLTFHVPSTFHKKLMLRSHGVGWGGVGWGCYCSFGHVPSTLHMMPMPWGGVGWGDANVHPTLHKTLMLHQWGGVGWGDDNTYSTLRKTLMLRTRWSNHHGLRWGGVGAFCSNLLGFC